MMDFLGLHVRFSVEQSLKNVGKKFKLNLVLKKISVFLMWPFSSVKFKLIYLGSHYQIHAIFIINKCGESSLFVYKIQYRYEYAYPSQFLS